MNVNPRLPLPGRILVEAGGLLAEPAMLAGGTCQDWGTRRSFIHWIAGTKSANQNP